MIIKLDQAMPDIKELKKNIEELGESLNLDVLKSRIDDLNEKINASGFWDDPSAAKPILKELTSKKNTYDKYMKLKKGFDDLFDLIDLAIAEDDESLADEILSEFSLLKPEYENQKIEVLLSGEFDGNNAILSIHPGAGGTEAQDWAQMLYRMYCRFAERRKFKVKVLDYLDGDEAGIKSVSILIEGENAYGYLKSEHGVHRLVRVSPFDSSGRRHTSFASVEVMPEFNDDMDIVIDDADIKIDTHRSSGAGGQHINKTDSAVRITHIPTGIVVG